MGRYTKEDIKSSLDLSEYGPGEYQLPLIVIPPDDVRVVGLPINIDVRIKQLEAVGPTTSPDQNNPGNVQGGASDNNDEEQ